MPNEAPLGYTLQHAAVSDVGMRRANNQDAYAVSLGASVENWHERGHLLCVADGMGAHAAGELASRLAADNIPHLYEKLDHSDPPQALGEAIRRANALIHEKGQASVEFHGMGTTCSALLLLPQGAVAAHVGDSRVYRLRNQKLEQLTFDHSLVWEMAQAGRVREEELPQFVPKNVITRSLGPHKQVEVDLEGPFPLAPGDTFLLCSDGLTGPINDNQLAAILATLPADEAAQALVDLANLAGGPDNITVIVAKITHDDPSPKPGNTPEHQDEDPTESTENPPGTSQSNPLQLMGAIVLLIAGVGALIASWALHQPLLGLAAVASAAIGLGLLVWRRPQQHQLTKDDNLLFGGGPYRDVDVDFDSELLHEFEDPIERLEKNGAESPWSLDWSKMKDPLENARAAQRDGDGPSSLRAYSQVFRLLMEQIRSQRRPPAHESGIDLL